MSMNVKCKGCGSTNVQYTSKCGFPFWFLLPPLYPIHVFNMFFRLISAFLVFLCYDLWAMIIKAFMGKRHTVISKRCFYKRKSIYFCHDCGLNFKF